MRYSFILRLKNHKMTPVFFALFTEFLILVTLGFVALFSIETLLPTFVSARINLALYFGILLALFISHHALSIGLDLKIHTPSLPVRIFLIAFLSLWGIILIALSLLEFPILAIIIILLTCVLLGYLFRKIYSLV